MISRPRPAATIRILILVLALSALGVLAAGAQAATPKLERASGGGAAAPSGEVPAAVREHPYLVPSPAALRAEKAAAARRAGPARLPSPAAGLRAPTTSRSWKGIDDPAVSPSDSTSAVGTTRFVETINNMFAIYDKTNDAPIQTGTLQQLWGTESAATTDPQVIWDPGTRRFYYAGLVFDEPRPGPPPGDVDNALTFGFSKTTHPDSHDDFCKYLSRFGSDIPDYPKLGDSQHFALIGFNRFSGGKDFLGPDALAITKPVSGPIKTCPAPGDFVLTIKHNLKNQNGTKTGTPVPVNQTDSAPTGWIVATERQSAGGNELTLIKVTRNNDHTADFHSPGTKVAVPAYDVPPDAPQDGTTNVLDTLDSRLTQAVSSMDPSKSGRVGIWTQHTVAGGAGSEVRWYELNPKGFTVFRSGKASHAFRYAFNGAISSDRAVDGTTRRFGQSMVLGYNASSATSKPAILAVSKVRSDPQSAPLPIVTSPNSDAGFDCTGTDINCRWGDYAAATPDPNPPLTSQVWLTNMWNEDPPSATESTWATQNFVVTP